MPRRQFVCDMHTPEGIRAGGLSATYPLDGDGAVEGHDRCQLVGKRAKEQGLRGVRGRSAQSPDGSGRALARFPALVRSVARRAATLVFPVWFEGCRRQNGECKGNPGPSWVLGKSVTTAPTSGSGDFETTEAKPASRTLAAGLVRYRERGKACGRFWLARRCLSALWLHHM